MHASPNLAMQVQQAHWTVHHFSAATQGFKTGHCDHWNPVYRDIAHLFGVCNLMLSTFL